MGHRIGSVAIWIALTVLACGEARAALVTYAFTGVVNSDTAGLLFPTKNPGDPFSGSFVLDTGATIGFANTEVASYTGTFTIVLDALTFNATGIQVWSGSYVDGFEILFPVPIGSGGGTVGLSMRSSANIYAGPSVPSSVNLADFDVLHQISYAQPFPAPGSDKGTITSLSQVPEPTTALLLGVGLGLLAIDRNRRSSH